MLEKYQQDSSNLLHVVSKSLELALFSEQEMGVVVQQEADPHHQQDYNNDDESTSKTKFLFSQRLQTHLDRVSAALEHNEKELKHLMQQFPLQFSLPSSQQQQQEKKEITDDSTMPKVGKANSTNSHKNDKTSSTLFTLNNRFAGMSTAAAADPTKKNAYDCGAQVIAHIVRDWTILGDGVRKIIYDWCRSMVEKHVARNNNNNKDAAAPRILVPGAGLGRLAYDLAFATSGGGYAVEANEISLSMAAGAHAILQSKHNGTIYPFALDFFANEVEANRRYDSVEYPVYPKVTRVDNNGTLSYTLGDFVKIYRWQRPPGATFQCVVTCFFIDTATNIYEYLSTIEHALAAGGIWINIGPLRWHHNSVLHPAADELRSMIESSVFSFQVLHWSVDDQPSSYRDDDNEYWISKGGDGFVRSTSYQGYRPLRFVVKRI